MRKFISPLLITVLFISLFFWFAFLIHNGNLQLLYPHGLIALQQSKLLWGAIFLGMIIGVIFVGAMFFVALTYRDTNKKARYAPTWQGGKWLILFWWIFPTIIILILSIVTWTSAHQLDPYQPISSPVKPITIQVVALRWKWLFLYPEEKIATINTITVPVNTPINFQLTADAPMNSFWIPSLGGQIYAMAGMVTQLHLIANQTGTFPGGAAEISGAGFSGMNFHVNAVSSSDYTAWVAQTKKSGKPLTFSTYKLLAQPSSDNPPAFYSYTDSNLYNEVIDQFMPPGQHMMMSGMSM